MYNNIPHLHVQNLLPSKVFPKQDFNIDTIVREESVDLAFLVSWFLRPYHNMDSSSAIAKKNQWNKGLNDAASTSVHIAKEVCVLNSSRAGNGDVMNFCWKSTVLGFLECTAMIQSLRWFLWLTPSSLWPSQCIAFVCRKRGPPDCLRCVKGTLWAAWTRKLLSVWSSNFSYFILSTWATEFVMVGFGVLGNLPNSPLAEWCWLIYLEQRNIMEPQTFPRNYVPFGELQTGPKIGQQQHPCFCPTNLLWNSCWDFRPSCREAWEVPTKVSSHTKKYLKLACYVSTHSVFTWIYRWFCYEPQGSQAKQKI